MPGGANFINAATVNRFRLGIAHLALVAGLALFAAAPAAKADEIDDLREELEALKGEVLYLQNQMPVGGQARSGGNLAADQEVRYQEMQRQISDLTGQIERVELKVNDMAAQLERMQKDIDFRLSELEGGGAAGSSAAGAATMGTTGDTAVANEPALDQQTDTRSLPAQQPAATTNAPQSTGILGTLTNEQAQNLPQAPAGAAEEAAELAAQQSAPVTAPQGIALQGNTPREQYDYATGFLQQGDYESAEAALRTFIEKNPSDPLAGNAQYWLGETYYVRNDFQNAAVAFAEGYQRYPQSQKAPDNLLKLAMSLGQQGQTQNACVALRQLDKKFPDASATIKDRALRARERYACN